MGTKLSVDYRKEILIDDRNNNYRKISLEMNYVFYNLYLRSSLRSYLKDLPKTSTFCLQNNVMTLFLSFYQLFLICNIYAYFCIHDKIKYV